MSPDAYGDIHRPVSWVKGKKMPIMPGSPAACFELTGTGAAAPDGVI